ncbi:MAG: CpaF family protein [Elusimicrobiota bacterium]
MKNPIFDLLSDPAISDIFVNGFRRIYCERNGKIEHCDVSFESNDDLYDFVVKSLEGAKIKFSEKTQYYDLRLADGSRMNVVMPPAAVDGICVSIRKPSGNILGPDDLVKRNTLTEEALGLLKVCVEKRKNIVISGGTGSGKTTLLNLLSSFISPAERIITIEDAAELRLPQEHVVRLEARFSSCSGEGTTIRQLVINALRMRPDRIVVGECRGGEALDMLVAMNTGHNGSLTTVHSNSTRDALKRIEVMCLMSGIELPVKAIREQISSAIDFIVQVARFADGSRKVTEIIQVFGLEGETITSARLFKIESGVLTSTGISPVFS